MSHEGGRVPRKHKPSLNCWSPACSAALPTPLRHHQAPGSPTLSANSMLPFSLCPGPWAPVPGAGRPASSQPLHALVFEGKGLAFF